MMTEDKFSIREINLQDDSLIAEHLCKLWRDNDVPAESIRSDWLEISLQFIDLARQELYYTGFVAEVEDRVVGSTSCQLFAGLYPNILEDQYKKSGYIWGVYVEPSYRGRGIAKKLMLEAVNYLKSLGCTRVVLHASPSGRPVYSRLGFLDSNEMTLDLSEVN